LEHGWMLIFVGKDRRFGWDGGGLNYKTMILFFAVWNLI